MTLLTSSVIRVGREQPGLDELIYKSIMTTDIDVRSHFYTNIILSGGTTLLPGKRCFITKLVTRHSFYEE